MAVHVFECSYQGIKFPAGEMHVRLTNKPEKDVHIKYDFDGSDSIIELLLVVNALKHCFIGVEELRIGYVPFGRQDRIAVDGESLSIEVFAELINSIGAKKITIYDPHSDVTSALIKNSVVVHQHEIFKPYFTGKSGFYLVAPDGGALKKVYPLAKEVDCVTVLTCSKERNVKTGEITGVQAHFGSLDGRDCYIVDDICDGGRTFIEVAKQLRGRGCGKIILMVTHGLFTKGIEVLREWIDEIITMNGSITDHTEDLY